MPPKLCSSTYSTSQCINCLKHKIQAALLAYLLRKPALSSDVKSLHLSNLYYQQSSLTTAPQPLGLWGTKTRSINCISVLLSFSLSSSIYSEDPFYSYNAIQYILTWSKRNSFQHFFCNSVQIREVNLPITAPKQGAALVCKRKRNSVSHWSNEGVLDWCFTWNAVSCQWRKCALKHPVHSRVIICRHTCLVIHSCPLRRGREPSVMYSRLQPCEQPYTSPTEALEPRHPWV